PLALPSRTTGPLRPPAVSSCSGSHGTFRCAAGSSAKGLELLTETGNRNRLHFQTEPGMDERNSGLNPLVPHRVFLSRSFQRTFQVRFANFDFSFLTAVPSRQPSSAFPFPPACVLFPFTC